MAERSAPHTLEDTLASLLAIDDRIAWLLTAALRREFHQINPHTTIEMVNSSTIELGDPNAFDPPVWKTRQVRKKGYRWQFHRALYELLDLPHYAAWGWEDQPYRDYGDIRVKSRTLTMRAYTIQPFEHPFGFAYDPPTDRLFIRIHKHPNVDTRFVK